MCKSIPWKRKSLPVPGLHMGRKLFVTRAFCVSVSRPLCQGCLICQGWKAMERLGDPVNCKLVRNLDDNANNCRDHFSQLLFVEKKCNLSLACQIKTRADPDEARTAGQRKGGGDPARVSGLQWQRESFPVISCCADLFDAGTCVLKLHGCSLLCFYLCSLFS